MTSSSGTNRVSYMSASGDSSGPGSTRTSRGSIGGTLTRAKCSLAGLGVDEDDGEVEREPGDVGERVGRVDGQRGEDGEEPVGEDAGQPLALDLGQLVPAHDRDALLLEHRADLLGVDAGVHRHQLVGDAGDLLEDLARLEPGGRPDGDAGGDPPLEAGDPDHEELVEVLGEDREEAGALEQRDARVCGELEHPLVELQPGDLAVQEAVGGQAVVGLLDLLGGAHEASVGAARLLVAGLAGRGARDRDLADDGALGGGVGRGVPGGRGAALLDVHAGLFVHADHPVRSRRAPPRPSRGVHPGGRISVMARSTGRRPAMSSKPSRR